MKRVKNKFLTFIFSLLPGAGHMYLGFMKMGLSLMAAFFFLIFLSSWLRIGSLLIFSPLIWFYSFFDCMNKCYSNEEEFLQIEDNYLFSIDKLVKMDKGIIKKHSLLSGIMLVFIGGYLILNNIIHSINGYISEALYNTIYEVMGIAPQLIIGIIIIIFGVKLIIGKKKECDLNE